ncbi:MAG: hypothetical protein JW748_07415 [Anaerolineales bacterium]|nr:hypothetical protein [Anaerolineales bacterium]
MAAAGRVDRIIAGGVILFHEGHEGKSEAREIERISWCLGGFIIFQIYRFTPMNNRESTTKTRRHEDNKCKYPLGVFVTWCFYYFLDLPV